MGPLDWLSAYPKTAILAALAVIGAAIGAYAREQTSDVVLWLLNPITKRLPWNNPSGPDPDGAALTSLLTIVDVQLASADGRSARYRKTSLYQARYEVRQYREGVSASGEASAFRTARGRILRTVLEHGFYMSEIDLGVDLRPGDDLLNVYEAELHESFRAQEQNWTQQVSFETQRLIIQIHFPRFRPPLRCAGSLITGTEEQRSLTNPQIVELNGRKSLVWSIRPLARGDIYKLSWAW